MASLPRESMEIGVSRIMTNTRPRTQNQNQSSKKLGPHRLLSCQDVKLELRDGFVGRMRTTTPTPQPKSPVTTTSQIPITSFNSSKWSKCTPLPVVNSAPMWYVRPAPQFARSKHHCPIEPASEMWPWGIKC